MNACCEKYRRGVAVTRGDLGHAARKASRAKDKYRERLIDEANRAKAAYIKAREEAMAHEQEHQ